MCHTHNNYSGNIPFLFTLKTSVKLMRNTNVKIKFIYPTFDVFKTKPVIPFPYPLPQCQKKPTEIRNPTKLLLSAEWASMSEKGALPCLISQTQSMPSCPPVATMCCWLGCLSTQCRGTLSPDLGRITSYYKSQIRRTNVEKLYFCLWKSYKERIWDGVLLCCLKSHSLSWPMEFTVKISVVLR